ncbi:hypothetical protein D8S78_03370 [Natrialba swarupiae]|nr:hypothetical protein [Natrialba swarupiae]
MEGTEYEHEEWSIGDWLEISTVYALDYESRTHYHVDIPKEVQEHAHILSKSEIDSRDQRDFKESKHDSEQGKIAEFAFATVCEHEDVDWGFHDGFQTGDLEVGGLRIDVKSRRENEDGYKDLLVFVFS